MTRWDFFPLELGPEPAGPGVCGGWVITSYFGGRTDPITGIPGTHGGEDLAHSSCTGAAIYAPSSGTMSQGWDPSGGGNWTGITLDDGSYIGIGHALAFAPGAPYRRVAAGELVAYVDSTGASTGAHAHVCYRPAGSPYYADPHDLLMDSSSRPVGGVPPIPPLPIGEAMEAEIVEGSGSLWVVWYIQDASSGRNIPFSKTYIPSDNAKLMWRDDYGIPEVGPNQRMIDAVPTTGMVGNTPDAAD